MCSRFAFALVVAAEALACVAGMLDTDYVCGTATGAVTGVKKQARKHEVFGVDLDPLPEITFDANCKTGERKITRCSYESAVVVPSRSGIRARSETFLLTAIPGGYQCHLTCDDVVFAELWCKPWPKGVCAEKTKETVTAVRVQLREEDVKQIPLANLPSIGYDADCAARKITKCTLDTPHVVVPVTDAVGVSKPFSMQAVYQDPYKCVLRCHAKYVAVLDCSKSKSLLLQQFWTSPYS